MLTGTLPEILANFLLINSIDVSWKLKTGFPGPNLFSLSC